MPQTPLEWRADVVATLGIAALCLAAGGFVRSRVRWIERSNIPAAVVGGVLLAALVMALRPFVALRIDDTLRMPLQMAFFAAIGFQITVRTLRAGGRQMVLFWLIACGTAVAQNAAGVLGALALGVPPAIGLICGAVTLTGGPATGMAFTDTFRALGVPAAGEIILAAATFGICVSSLIGNPIASRLVRRPAAAAEAPATPAPVAPRPAAAVLLPDLMRNLILLSLAMGAGSLLGAGLAAAGIQLSVVIGPMIVAALMRWVDERWGCFRLDAALLEMAGSAALSFFLAIALGGLKLWELAALAGPLIALLALETVVTVLYCLATTWVFMGRDYEAAVMTTGHIGFGLGITANAIANMETMAAKYGPAPRAFLIVPVIGGFFVDFVNSILIAVSAGLLRSP